MTGAGKASILYADTWLNLVNDGLSTVTHTIISLKKIGPPPVSQGWAI
jgi:hypothetical protein